MLDTHSHKFIFFFIQFLYIAYYNYCQFPNGCPWNPWIPPRSAQNNPGLLYILHLEVVDAVLPQRVQALVLVPIFFIAKALVLIFLATPL